MYNIFFFSQFGVSVVKKITETISYEYKRLQITITMHVLICTNTITKSVHQRSLHTRQFVPVNTKKSSSKIKAAI